MNISALKAANESTQSQRTVAKTASEGHSKGLEDNSKSSKN